MIPCITPACRMWLGAECRLLSPVEKLRLQGLLLEDESVLHTFSDMLLSDLAGNAMCGPIVAAVIIVGLVAAAAFVTPKASSPPTSKKRKKRHDDDLGLCELGILEAILEKGGNNSVASLGARLLL